MIELLQVFTTAQGWIELVTLMFLEVALGVDNLVFIAITSARLPEEKRHIGRRLGLLGAMVIRCVLLCCITAIMSVSRVLVTLPFGVVDGATPLTFRELIFVVGGIYLIYKGIAELRELAVSVGTGSGDGTPAAGKSISLPHAVTLIILMDIVFSLDSVITAAGLSGHILIMCSAVILAVLIMIVFADPISDFINNNPEIKVVALVFVLLVGVMLVFEGFYLESVKGIPLNAILYVLMVLGLIAAIVRMLRRIKREKAARAVAKAVEADEASPMQTEADEASKGE